MLSGLVSAGLAASAVLKFLGAGPDTEQAFAHLGLPMSIRVPLAAVELACAVLYVVPATSILGAILVAGYMGGAIVTHWRLGEPIAVQIAIGIVAWFGLWLREPRLRALLPIRTSAGV